MAAHFRDKIKSLTVVLDKVHYITTAIAATVVVITLMVHGLTYVYNETNEPSE